MTRSKKETRVPLATNSGRDDEMRARRTAATVHPRPATWTNDARGPGITLQVAESRDLPDSRMQGSYCPRIEMHRLDDTGPGA